MLAGGAWSLVPPAVRRRVDDPAGVVRATADVGSDRLLDAHAAWAGAPPGRWDATVPPHTFARWAMPVIARLTAKAPHGLLGVLNQGVRVRVGGPIPRGAALALEGRLGAVDVEEGRVVIRSRVDVARPGDPAAMRIDVHAVVPTGPRARRDADDVPAPAWEEAAAWSADADDGRRFFFLTGDFHPLHTLGPVARRTRFGGCILHGFGTYARTWEALLDGGLDVTDLDVRFTAATPLPTPRVSVQVAPPDADGHRPVRAVSADGTVLLRGAVG